MSERELLIKAALNLDDPLLTPAGNLQGFVVALDLKLSAALTQPRLAPFGAALVVVI